MTKDSLRDLIDRAYSTAQPFSVLAYAKADEPGRTAYHDLIFLHPQNRDELSLVNESIALLDADSHTTRIKLVSRFFGATEKDADIELVTAVMADALTRMQDVKKGIERKLAKGTTSSRASDLTYAGKGGYATTAKNPEITVVQNMLCGKRGGEDQDLAAALAGPEEGRKHCLTGWICRHFLPWGRLVWRLNLLPEHDVVLRG